VLILALVVVAKGISASFRLSLNHILGNRRRNTALGFPVILTQSRVVCHIRSRHL
jgi:hypothetical protein